MISLAMYFADGMARHSLKIERPLMTNSPLGIFVRKCRVEYLKSDFASASRLWSLFKLYRGQSSGNARSDFEPEELNEFGYYISKAATREEIGNYHKILSHNSVCSSWNDIEKFCNAWVEKLES
jgi:hypothetical protein